MRALVTGASGFIGSHVARALLNAGHEVGAVVRPQSDLRRLRDIETSLTLLPIDLHSHLADMDSLAEWHPDACIHLAWYVEPGRYLHAPENVDALQAALKLLAALQRSGCRQFIGAGTCFEYDTDRGWLKEDGPTRPDTLYAAAKLSLCHLGARLVTGSEMRFAWARIFYLYGPDEDARRVVPALFNALSTGQEFAATEGAQVRDYLHVEDVAAAFRILAEQKAEGVYNVGSGAAITMRQLMHTVGSLIGRPELIRFGATPYRPWDPRFICADVDRLRSLGWSPRYSLEEGLHAALHAWRRYETGQEPGR